MRIPVDVRFALTFLLTVLGASTVHAQCYTFSSGNQASLMVSFPNLPQLTSGTPGLYQYTLTTANTSGDTATLTLGQTSYAFLPAPPELQEAASEGAFGGGIQYTYISYPSGLSLTGFEIALLYEVAGLSPDRPIAVNLALQGEGNLLPNGLPASFPSISAWSLTPRQIQVSFESSPSQVFVVDGITTTTTCSGSPASGLPAFSGVVSASAFGQFASVAPGSWTEIYGSNLATTTRSWTGADFNGVDAPTSLAGTQVTIGGQAAFVDYVSPGQVNAQVPSNVAIGPQQIVVTTPNGSSASQTITVNATQPGLLAPASFKIGGTQYAAALFSDGKTFVLPPGAIAGLPSRRAQPGDTITFYGVGFGAVVPNIPAGQIVQDSNMLVSTFQMDFGTTPGTINYDGLAPAAIGLYQFNVVVPDIPGSDAVPLTFSLDGAPGAQMLYLAVQNGE